MKKNEASAQYTPSKYKVRPVTITQRRELDDEVTPVFNEDEKSWIVDDVFPRELSMKQWAEDRSRSATQRDAALGYCSLKFFNSKHEECDEPDAVLVEIERPFRRLNGAMSVSSLVGATRNRTRKGKSKRSGTERAVSDYTNAIIFSAFSGEKEMWLQLLTLAEKFYGKDEFTMTMKLLDQIEYHVDAGGGFDVTVDIWAFVPEEAEVIEEVTE